MKKKNPQNRVEETQNNMEMSSKRGEKTGNKARNEWQRNK